MKTIYAFLIIFILLFSMCEKESEVKDLTKIENTLGFEILSKTKGIWAGPVTSTTAIGSFPEWVVDFRPIAENHISAKNELDTLNDIFMSFFVTKYKNEFKIAFRNGGSFAGNKRVSYLLCDSVFESDSKSYYRFSEAIIGKNRAYTEVIFSADSMYLNAYTNHYNTQISTTPHMAWRAKRQNTSAYVNAVNLFGFPKKSLTKDFSNSFAGQSQSIFFGTNIIPLFDPFKESDHPYLGKATISYQFSSTFIPDVNKKVFLLLTTQPLIGTTGLNTANLTTRSRYVILSAADLSFEFNYMHPGTYYVYALYDNDANAILSSTDWISATNASFTLLEKGTASKNVEINFTIP